MQQSFTLRVPFTVICFSEAFYLSLSLSLSFYLSLSVCVSLSVVPLLLLSFIWYLLIISGFLPPLRLNSWNRNELRSGSIWQRNGTNTFQATRFFLFHVSAEKCSHHLNIFVMMHMTQTATAQKYFQLISIPATVQRNSFIHECKML